MEQPTTFDKGKAAPSKRRPKPPQKRSSKLNSRRKRSTGAGRHKVKALRAQSGRYRFLVLRKDTPLLLSRQEYAKVGDAKSAGKAKARELAAAHPPWPWHKPLEGYCIECLTSGDMRKGVGAHGMLCRDHWEQRGPGQLARWGE